MDSGAIKVSSKGEKIADIANDVFDRIVTFIFVIILLFCAYAIYDSVMVVKEAEVPSSVKKYVVKNDSGEDRVDFEQLKAINDEIVGWVRVNNTPIDFPIVHTNNNKYYLNRGFDKEYLTSGSIFLDMYNSADFSDEYNVIYGHNMNRHKMFGVINDFSNSEYFNAHEKGRLFTPRGDWELDIVAYLVTDRSDMLLYDTEFLKNGHNQEILERARTIARNARIMDPSKKVLVMSTCYGVNNERGILVATYSED